MPCTSHEKKFFAMVILNILKNILKNLYFHENEVLNLIQFYFQYL